MARIKPTRPRTERPPQDANPPAPPAEPHPPAHHRAGRPEDGFVRVRMYRQGLGDCFLLTFFPKGGEKFHMLIDCGVILGTPGAADLMKQVVADIRTETDDRIDVLVVTHEHWDHVSGFDKDGILFKGDPKLDDPFKKPVQFKQVWMAWTENPKDELANLLRSRRAEKVAALWMGVQRMRMRLKAMGVSDPDASGSSAAAVLAFFGIDADDPHPEKGFGAAAAEVETGRTAQAMRWLRDRDEVRFHTPGTTIEGVLPEGVRVHVLGPPHDEDRLKKDMPTKAGAETYEEEHERKPAFSDGVLFGFPLALSDTNDEADRDASPPFDRKYRIPWNDAAELPFFKRHYFDGSNAEDWRRIDQEWTGSADAFALQLDSDTNNTSLALAIELPDGRVLLFPGDAQVGNWESWHVDEKKKQRQYQSATGRPVTAERLLNRTVLYKVGHHGSHNATLRGKGLEMMTDRDALVALVPVDTYIAHCKKNWGKMPFDPLMKRLKEKTGDRIVLVDSKLDLDLIERIGGELSAKDARTKITVIQGDDVPDKKQRNERPVERPLYVDLFIPITKAK